MLDEDIKKQLIEYMNLLEGEVILSYKIGNDDSSKEMLTFLEEISAMSPKITLLKDESNHSKANNMRSPSFCICTKAKDYGISFACIPLGHEFTSFVLALLQVSGRPPKTDSSLIHQIKSLKGPYAFETYISLSCHNCPEVVQSLNLMALLNPNITHTAIDGAIYREEVETKEIMAVPTVYVNGKPFGTGRMTLEDILEKLGESKSKNPDTLSDMTPFDILVIGGGPAGSSAAVYAARKGIRTALLAKEFGGQVRETQGIENFVSIPYTEGNQLADNLEKHVRSYPVSVIRENAVEIHKSEFIEVTLENGSVLKSKTAIIATGARWRHIGVPGEDLFKYKGVAYCPHCDGPLYKDKTVAVIGGGNSGIEAAIDLAGIAKHVTVLEFLPELKADAVLIKRLYELKNITVIKNAATKEITGTTTVNGLIYTDRNTNEEKSFPVQGVFVQIGLVPNTGWVKDTIEQNRLGEIITDSHNMTSIAGIFAAGDCTTTPYKQIIISMGSGAAAALGAFDYLLRN